MASTGSEAAGTRMLPRLSWSAVIAGALLALATHVVLGLLGAAMGLAAGPADSEGLGIGAAIWGLLTPFVATLLGAWLAVKLSGERDDAGANVHGVVVWCIGLLVGALFLAGTLATGAMSAGTAASGNAGALQRLTGTTQRDVQSPQNQAEAERASEKAAGGAAAAAGGGAMAALCGLLGAFAGSALARRRSSGKGLGFRIALQRTDGQRANGGMAAATHTRVEDDYRERERTYQPPPGRVETTREVTRTEQQPPSSDPFHH